MKFGDNFKKLLNYCLSSFKIALKTDFCQKGKAKRLERR